jgi:hypothetical protein
MVTAMVLKDTPEQHDELKSPSIVGDDVRSLIILRQTRNQRLLTSSPTASGNLSSPNNYLASLTWHG